MALVSARIIQNKAQIAREKRFKTVIESLMADIYAKINDLEYVLEVKYKPEYLNIGMTRELVRRFIEAEYRSYCFEGSEHIYLFIAWDDSVTIPGRYLGPNQGK